MSKKEVSWRLCAWTHLYCLLLTLKFNYVCSILLITFV